MKRLISLAVSLIVLGFIYGKIDFPQLVQVLSACDRPWLGVSLGMVVPLTMMTAWRLQQLMPAQGRLGLGEANQLILVASVLNMVLPSKMGDIAKAYFMRERGHLTGSLSLTLVVFEKACDMLSLLLWCAFGLVFYPHQGWLFGLMAVSVTLGLIMGGLLLTSRRIAQELWQVGQRLAPRKFRPNFKKLQVAWDEMHTYFWGDRHQLLQIVMTSVMIWFLHLLQIWFFILALNAWTPFIANLALAPLAILAGLLPLTFAGIGTRDAALILFYQPYLDASTAAALGLLCTSRYLIPALGGLPFLWRYGAMIQQVRLPQLRSKD